MPSTLPHAATTAWAAARAGSMASAGAASSAARANRILSVIGGIEWVVCGYPNTAISATPLLTSSAPVIRCAPPCSRRTKTPTAVASRMLVDTTAIT